MPDSRVLDIRNAVVDYLNNYDFGIDFIAIPSNVAFARQEDLSRTTVYVSPASIVTGPDTVETRGKPGSIIQIAIVIMRPLLTNTTQEQDELVALAEQIPKALYGQPMANAKMTTVEDGGSRTLFEAADIENASLFAAEVNMFYVDGE